jgi:hypothetical protein
MRRLTLAVALLVVPACFLLNQPGGGVAAGGTFVLDVSSKQGTNLGTDHFEAKTIAGNYNSRDNPLQGNGGWSIVIGTPSLLDNTTCKGLSLGFAGPPVAGATIALDLPADAKDAGITDPKGRGLFVVQDGCVLQGPVKQWRATSGTLTIDKVEAPQTSAATTARAISFHYSGATMVVDPSAFGDAGASGSFTANGTGNVELFAE